MDVWVIDTSSIIDLRKIPHTTRAHVLAALDGMVDIGQLFFPPEVLGELERHNEKSDVASKWAKKNSAKAAKYGHLFSKAKAVLKILPKLIDPSKVSSTDDADPYVIALAQCLFEEGHDPTIITEDRKSVPNKTSLADAAGVFKLPSVSLSVFLETRGTYTNTKNES
ncbi:MAG: DUF4411 family protein [Nitrospira sp.]|nr:DUF4411 family protein [Nitrospira sp.]